jgi:hypothetical protein
MSEEYYEVLYIPRYGGGLSFPDDFMNEVFQMYPPESEIGQELWRKTYDIILREGEEVPEGKKHYYRIIGTEEFCNGYVWLQIQNETGTKTKTSSKYCTKDFKSYYFIGCDNYNWRDSKEIIALVKEKGIDISIKKVPKDYDYYVDEYDGKETVIIECPTTRIIEDLLAIISNKQPTVHRLTQKLLDGESLYSVINPRKI